MLPKIPFTQFKTLKAQDIEASKSFKVTSNGNISFLVIVPRTSYVETAVEELGMISNTMGGKDMGEVS